jgi:uncharacterized protein (DUF2141 family)
MLKKILPLFFAIGLLYSIPFAEENYTLSGDVTFSEDGDIYICLLTKEGFRGFQTPGHELTPQKCKVIKMNTDLKGAGKVSFKLDSVPKGTYCILALQDVNNNGKVDFEQYVISEPLGSYKEGDPSLALRWDDIKFDLEKDITGIQIQM